MRRIYAVAISAALVAAACDCGAERALVKVDGSSTVYPVTEAVAEEFQKREQGARVTVGVSGSGGGFQKFCRGETHVSDASRPIKPSEVEACEQAGIEYVELPVAYDGIAIVVHPDNDWVDSITVEELRRIWQPGAQNAVKKWSDVREDWPDRELHLFGPGVDSGTYDYFTAAVTGEEGASRGDFTSSEDDNVLVQGVSNDPYALGFFGYAYYEENQDALKLLAVDDGDPENGQGPIAPSPQTVGDGTYQPLSRPLFIYVSTSALDNEPTVESFVEFYLESAPELVREVGYIPLPERVYELAERRVAERQSGSLFGEGSQVGVSLEDLMAQ